MSPSSWITISLHYDDSLTQCDALGTEGIQKIRDSIRNDGLVYVGICTGAFLACENGIAPGLATHDDENFGFSNARGTLNLKVATKV